jgi:hypothetical protein
MSTTRPKPHFTNAVVERLPAPGSDKRERYVIAAVGLDSVEHAQKETLRLAKASPGIIYAAAQLWPGAVAEVTTVTKCREVPETLSVAAKTKTPAAKATAPAATPIAHSSARPPNVDGDAAAAGDQPPSLF